jgi:hypothetical protein
VVDLKPPRVVDDERTTLLEFLRYLRESVVRKVDGVSEADARRRFVDSDTTLLWLLKHLRRAESIWMEQRFAGLDVTLPPAEVGPDDTVAAAVEAYRQGWAISDAIAEQAPDLDVMTANTGSESPVSLRWVLAHLVEETARHAGHADILRELIDGSTGR